MDSSLRLGMIWGIPIRMHLSWIIILIFMTWSLAVGYFPGEYKTDHLFIYWVSGFLSSIIVIISVLLHEAGHAYAAIKNQVPVKNITLFIFGGVAEISQEPSTSKAEFTISFVGPFVSFILSFLFWAFWLVFRQNIIIASPSAWLGRMNLILAVFNIIPAFPLDGGRLLRSIIWSITRDQLKATRISSLTGQVIAFSSMFLGVIFILKNSLFNGILLILIGWFLNNSAVNAYTQVSLRQVLQKALVWQIMSRDLPIVQEDLPLDLLVNDQIILQGKRFFLVLRKEDNSLAGVITIHKINKIHPEKWQNITTREIMIPLNEVQSITPDYSLLDALQVMDDRNVAQVPVLGTRNMVVGILTREQIIKYLRNRAENRH